MSIVQFFRHPGPGGSHYYFASGRSMLSPHIAGINLQELEHESLGGSHSSSPLTTLSPHVQQTEGAPKHLYPWSMVQDVLQPGEEGGSHVYLFTFSVTPFPHLSKCSWIFNVKVLY